MDSEKKYMLAAIKEARKNISRMDGGPFGACIAENGKIIAVARNTVLSGDASCHAEINAIREASARRGGYDLSGCVIYSTTEPCPMCFSAIHWARLDRIIYGTRVADAKKIGFNEMPVSNRTMKRIGRCGVVVKGGCLRRECAALLRDWSRSAKKVLY